MPVERLPNIDDDTRLAALDDYAIIDTPNEPAFDNIVALARDICETPVALISFVETQRQWFKAAAGFDGCETPIGQSVCAHAVAQGSTLIIPDLTRDDRTKANTLVTEAPHIRFYAGALLRTPASLDLGTLCVIDTVPRPQGLSPNQTRQLELLAEQVMATLELRRQVADKHVALREERQSRITALRRAFHSEAEIKATREEQELERMAQEAGGVGTFDLDISTNILRPSAEMCRIFGLPVEDEFDASVFEAAILAADKTKHSDLASRQAGAAIGITEYRINRKSDGAVRWIARRAQFFHDDDSQPVLFAGTVHDITDRKYAEAFQLALMTLGEFGRSARSSSEVASHAAMLVGQALGASRAGYAVVEQSVGALRIESDWADADFPRLIGDFDIASTAETMRRLADGKPVIVGDFRNEAWIRADRQAYEKTACPAHLMLPIIRARELAGILYVHDEEARSWTQDEINFAAAMASQLHAAIGRLRAEEEQRVVNHELSHRLKNTLAMVLAIAQQTLRGVADKSVLDAYVQRVIALGSAHDVLLQTNWTAALIREVLSKVLAAVAPDGRLISAGPEIRLGAKATLSLSLLLHELGTNSLKYGAWSNDSGVVELEWRVDRTHAVPSFVLTWRERGGPTVVPPERQGFGSKIIRMGLVGTGQSNVAYPQTGMEASFSVPLTAVREEAPEYE